MNVDLKLSFSGLVLVVFELHLLLLLPGGSNMRPTACTVLACELQNEGLIGTKSSLPSMPWDALLSYYADDVRAG